MESRRSEPRGMLHTYVRLVGSFVTKPRTKKFSFGKIETNENEKV